MMYLLKKQRKEKYKQLKSFSIQMFQDSIIATFIKKETVRSNSKKSSMYVTATAVSFLLSLFWNLKEELFYEAFKHIHVKFIMGASVFFHYGGFYVGICL